MDFYLVFDFAIGIIKLLFYWVYFSLIALLPTGILPRKSVKGKIVLITGSGGGLGRILAQKFGELGAKIVLWDIDEKLNTETKKLLDEAGVEAYAYKVDLSQKKQIYDQAQRVIEEIGPVDILINNAGIVNGKSLFECSDELMEKTMAVNTNALFFTAKAFVPAMMENQNGHVVSISSLAGLQGVKGLVDYCASKFAAIGFNESLRAEFHDRKLNDLHVTTVCPFYMSTQMFSGVKTYSSLFPILDPRLVADRTIEAVLTNATEVIVPRSAYIFVVLKSFLPTKVSTMITDYYGFNSTMNTFVGRTST